MRVKHIDDLYTWEQINKLTCIFRFNHHNGYVPIAVYALHEGCTAHYSGKPDHYGWYGRRKAYYAKRVWEQTRMLLRHMESSATAYEIVQASECFNTIRFSNKAKNAEYTKLFWETLESVANSGTIKVFVGRLPKRPYPWDPSESYEEIVIDDNDDYKPHQSHPEITECRECDGLLWEDVKHYFVQLTEDELALLHGEQILNRQPTEIDKELLAACEKVDVEGIKVALSRGANPNAFSIGPWSEAAMPLMISSYSHMEEDKNEPALFESIKLLLDAGYDINLSPCDNATALYESTLSDPSIVKFLLENGADPNTICWIDAQDYSTSTVLDSLSDDIACHGKLPELVEMFKMVEDAGGKFLYELKHES